MSFDTHDFSMRTTRARDICQSCGATAFEVPDESGRTWCAVCGEAADVGIDSDEDEESLADEDARDTPHARHRPSVRGMRARSVAAQLSDRVAGASRSDRDAYYAQDDDQW